MRMMRQRHSHCLFLLFLRVLLLTAAAAPVAGDDVSGPTLSFFLCFLVGDIAPLVVGKSREYALNNALELAPRVAAERCRRPLKSGG